METKVILALLILEFAEGQDLIPKFSHSIRRRVFELKFPSSSSTNDLLVRKDLIKRLYAELAILSQEYEVDTGARPVRD